MTSKATVTSLIKTHEDVTPNTGREMNLSLQVELDTDGQRGSLQVAVVVDGALEEVTCIVRKQVYFCGCGREDSQEVGVRDLPTGPLAVPERPGSGRLWPTWPFIWPFCMDRSNPRGWLGFWPGLGPTTPVLWGSLRNSK